MESIGGARVGGTAAEQVGWPVGRASGPSLNGPGSIKQFHRGPRKFIGHRHPAALPNNARAPPSTFVGGGGENRQYIYSVPSVGRTY